MFKVTDWKLLSMNGHEDLEHVVDKGFVEE